MDRRLARRRCLAGLAALPLVGAGCSERTATRTANTTGNPRVFANCGSSVPLPSTPRRIVAVEGAAETLFALGIAAKVAGWFGAPRERLPEPYRTHARRTRWLGKGWPPPSLEAITAQGPDLLVLLTYYPDAGVTRGRLDELGIPSYVLSEGCDPPTPTLEAFYNDTLRLGEIVGAHARAKELVSGWRRSIASPGTSPGRLSVLANHSPDPERPMAFARSSLAHDMIATAGGRNVVGDTNRSFVSPSWEEILERDPDVIVDGSGGGPEGTAALRSYLRRDRALSGMSAVRADRFLTLPYEETVAGPRVVDGVVKLARYLRNGG